MPGTFFTRDEREARVGDHRADQRVVVRQRPPLAIGPVRVDAGLDRDVRPAAVAGLLVVRHHRHEAQQRGTTRFEHPRDLAEVALDPVLFDVHEDPERAQQVELPVGVRKHDLVGLVGRPRAVARVQDVDEVEPEVRQTRREVLVEPADRFRAHVEAHVGARVVEASRQVVCEPPDPATDLEQAGRRLQPVPLEQRELVLAPAFEALGVSAEPDGVHRHVRLGQPLHGGLHDRFPLSNEAVAATTCRIGDLARPPYGLPDGEPLRPPTTAASTRPRTAAVPGRGSSGRRSSPATTTRRDTNASRASRSFGTSHSAMDDTPRPSRGRPGAPFCAIPVVGCAPCRTSRSPPS